LSLRAFFPRHCEEQSDEAIPATGRIIVKRVKGFDKASKLLTRENFWESFTTPPELTAQIKQVFGSLITPKNWMESDWIPWK
jgi:hypothetical protein